jgi:hypothetical protein
MRRTRIVTLATVAGTGLLVSGGLAVTGLAVTGLAVTGQAAAAGAATVAAVAAAPHGTITTIAGGRGGPAPATSVAVDPCALKYASGSLYISDGTDLPAAVYRVSQRTGVLTPVAGSGLRDGLYGEDEPAGGAPASEYSLESPCGVGVDGAGNLLVADSYRALAVAAKTGTFYGQPMTGGRVYTVGSGYESAGAVDVQVDSAGNLVIALAGEPASHTNDETYAQVIVKARRTGTFYGKPMVKGKTYVIAGLPRGGGGVEPPFVSAGARPASGVPAGQADLGFELGDVRFDAAGNIVLADPGGNGTGAIGGGSVVAPMVHVIPLRSGTFYHQAMKAGDVYTIAGDGDKEPDGVPAASAFLQSASGVALDHDGNVLIADNMLRVIAARNGTFYGVKMTAGDIYTLPGLPAANPQESAAETVAVDNVGNVLFGENNHVYLLAEKAGDFYGVRARAGRVYPIAGNGKFADSGDGGPATSAEFSYPAAVAANQPGTLTAVADGYPGAVRVIAVKAGRHFGRALRAGFIYTAAGQTDTIAGLGGPDGVAFDRAGNLVISDYEHSRVYVVANSSGVYYGQQMTAGHIYPLAGTGTEGFSGDGGPALAATLENPQGVAVDKNGNVLLIDSSIDAVARIRIVAASTGTLYGLPMTAGDIYTVAGTGTPGYSGDDGPATAAEIEPLGIAADASGNQVIADTKRIRVVAARTGTFYGQAMTAGDIYTVAGGGTGTVDGTPALSASLAASGVAVDQAGNLLVDGFSTVWAVAEKAGSYYGKTMRAGDVYTVAHSVDGGVFLDGIPATRALFSAAGIAVQPGTEDLLIADSLSARIRSVSR